MEILHTIEEMRTWRRTRWTRRVAFVPTMGYLHEGHVALIEEARRRADEVVVSVYVNPTQFAAGEDLSTYPRDLPRDQELCKEAGVTAFFTPDDAMMYGEGFATRVTVDGGMGDHLCGAHREGHFDGVTLIVSKLFLLVQPDVALFGQKDYQQLAIVRRLVDDLHFPIAIVGVPTVREPDGLAKSSRNRYLSDTERDEASVLSGALLATWSAWAAGERRVDTLLATARGVVSQASAARPDYISLIDPHTLQPLAERATVDEARGAVLALALHLGAARLIDNLRLDVPLPSALASLVSSHRFALTAPYVEPNK